MPWLPRSFHRHRIGDFGFLIAAFLMFGAFGSFQFETVFAKAPQASQGMILAITLLCCWVWRVNRPRLPLFVWLRMPWLAHARLGLIHAATMDGWRVPGGPVACLVFPVSQAQNIVTLVVV